MLNKSIVTARILYDTIKKFNKGLYVFANLDERSLINVCELIASAPVKTRDSTELHCTILHCKEAINVSEKSMPQDRSMTAYVVGVNEWIDHKNRKIWVFALESDDLEEVHNALVSSGFKHSHDEFNPHISIAKNVPDTDEAKDWFAQVNAVLADHRPQIRFDPVLRASTLA